MPDALYNLSPLDGRYQKEVSELSDYFSEAALIRYRAEIEKKYLIALLQLFKKATAQEIKKISQIKIKPERVKEIEKVTDHDVKSIEYAMREEFKKIGLKKEIIEFFHFALTSWDINNLANTLMFKDSLKKIYLRDLNRLIQELTKLAKTYKSLTILSLTHGQPATPTTLGKEIAVFVARLQRQTKFTRLLGKFNGATGNWAAHYLAYPKIDWLKFSERFVKSLDLEFNPLTTQIEPYDSLAENYQQIVRINNILKNFCQDVWLYISRGIFKQKAVKGEVGSSTMPHKINPIHFEKAEASFGMSSAVFNFMADKLTVSRFQRDLTDSATIRNQGLAMGYSLLGIKNILSHLNRLQADETKIKEELENNWEVLTEGIQTILRKTGCSDGYEKLKKLSRGKKIDKSLLRDFINSLEIPDQEKEKLLKLTPFNYCGISSQLLKYLKK